MSDLRAENLGPRGTRPETDRQAAKRSGAARAPAATAADVSANSQNVLRSAFIARVTAHSAMPTGSTAVSAPPAANAALRSAYLTHLTEGKVGGAGDLELHGGEPLRHAYLVHAAAHSGHQRDSPREGVEPVRRRRK